MKSNVSALSLSQDLVEYLRGRGQSLREIGELVGLSESFISRVASGQRSFTIEHLQLFEDALGEPLPALVLQATWANAVPKEKKPMFEEAVRILTDLGTLRRSLDRRADVDEDDPAAKTSSISRAAALRRAVG